MNIIIWLYGTCLGRILLFAVRYTWCSALVGYFADSWFSKPLIEPFARSMDVVVEEAEKPLSDYATFNEFFTRKLKKGARSIAASEIIMPCDGIISVYQDIDPQATIQIKDKTVYVGDVAGSCIAQEVFDGATMVVIHLRPQDYHHFHVPCDAFYSGPVTISGTYDSVDSYVYSQGYNPLSTNERHVIVGIPHEQREFYMVLVGALAVGRIIETYPFCSFLEKGSEMGYFAFGASTIILLFPRSVCELVPSLKKALKQREQKHLFVKMGQSLGNFTTIRSFQK